MVEPYRSACDNPQPVPVYEYKCANGHLFDVIQKMADEPLSSCQECGAPVERVLHPVAVHFKGSGFYNTDYGKKKGVPDGASAEGSSESKGKESGSSEVKPSEAKPSGGEKAKASSASE
jgi:putative FmdB family regulatory protein